MRTIITPSKRRLEIAPSVLANNVAKHHDESSVRLAERLGVKYSWTPEKRCQKTNIIRGMRAMECHITAKIRRRVPLNRTTELIDTFLDQIEEDCQRAEQHDSNEFV